MLPQHLLKSWASLDRRARWGLVACGALLSAWLIVRHAMGMPLGTDETWARIQREGTLRVGMDASYPPFEFVNEDEVFVGFDVELARELARRWGVTLALVNVHFDGLYDALKMDKFDLIISALPYDRTMTRDVLYSRSYFSAGQVLIARGDDQDLQSITDLDRRRVGVELGAEAHQLVRQLARDKGLSIEIVPQRELDQVVALLSRGLVDALVCDRVTAQGIVSGDSDLRLVGAPLTNEPYVIAARLDSPVLMERVNAGLDACQADGLLDDLGHRWF